jgi:hypothetical protein
MEREREEQEALFDRLRFQISGIFNALDKWAALSNLEFARTLYLEIRRLQTERDRLAMRLAKIKEVIDEEV